MTDDPRRAAAIKRIKEKRDFASHLMVYLAVNALLVVVWAMSGASYFWPIWPIAGWGIGLAMHAFETYRKPISEEAIQPEMGKGSDL